METENLSATGAASFDVPTDAASRLEKIRDAIADTLRTTSASLDEKAAAPDAQPTVARYARKAADWLDRSADCVSAYDCRGTDAKIRNYVGQNPGRSLLMAAAAGLTVGIVLRRR